MDITERLREYCVCDDGHPEQCAECAGAEEITTLRAQLSAKDVEIANTRAKRDTEVRKSIRLHMTNVDLSDSLMEALEDNRAWSRQVDTLRATIEAKDKTFDEMTDRFVEEKDAAEARLREWESKDAHEGMECYLENKRLEAEIAKAKEKLHKSDGMANEINILVQDSRDREQELAEAQKDTARVKHEQANVRLANNAATKHSKINLDRIAALEAEVAGLREDRDRLDYLRDHALAITYTGGRNGCAVTWLSDRDGDLRTAIDDARKNERNEE